MCNFLFRSLTLLCTTLIITSCASLQALPEIETPPRLIWQNGYSLVPLNEKGWLIAGRDSYRLALVKRGDNPDETYAIQAIPFRLPSFNNPEEFLSVIKEGQAKNADPQRFTSVKHEVTAYQREGTDCVKSYMLSEDYAAVKQSGNSGMMLLEALVLTCRHPKEERVGISITYSHRFYSGYDDITFAEKATKIFNTLEFFEPNIPYFPEPKKLNSESPPVKFSLMCSKAQEKASPELPPEASATKPDAMKPGDVDPIQTLFSIGISVGRNGSIRGDGSYALFQKDKNGIYSLTAVTPYYVEPNDYKNQEVLLVSSGLDSIAPAYASYKFIEAREAFLCGTGSSFVTGINSTDRSVYNPCDSALTSASNAGATIMANTALTVISAGLNLVTGSAATFVDTDKEKVARLVINSRLMECIKEAKQSKENTAKNVGDK